MVWIFRSWKRVASLFGRLSQQATKVLVITEGLIIYFTEGQVAELPRDLAAPVSFQRWVTDLASPGLVNMLQQQNGFAN